MLRHPATAFAAACVAFATHGSAQAATPTCRHLTGKDLAGNGVVKIVRLSLRGGHSQYVGCARPNGRAHPLSPILGTNSSGFRQTGSLQAVQGPFAVVKDSEIVAAGGSTRSRVIDVRTGRSYTFFAASGSEETTSLYRLGSPRVEVQNLPGALRSHLDRHGRLAVAYTGRTADNAAAATVVIAVFTASGKRTVLDQGDPGSVVATSLTLHDGTARWTSGGARRSAKLP